MLRTLRAVSRATFRSRIFRRTAAVFALACIFFVLWVSRDLPTAETFASRTIAQSTRIYDRTGDILLYDLHGDEKRTVISLTAVSPHLVNATIVAEDDRFYHHFGIDFAGIARSAFQNLRERRVAQGGSTITQQLVRNAVLTPEKTFARKIREAILAIEIEATFSKEEILEAYLNQIPYGSLVYGSEAASQTYFGKPARDLSLAEAAALAALPKAPSYYSPYGDRRDELLLRKDYILERMERLGYLTAQERDAAKEEELLFLPPREAIVAPHFVFAVQEELERRFGKERLERGGLRVVTTLDANLQAIAERTVREGAVRNERRFRGRNAALVALDPRSGDVLAMVGSRDYFDPAYDGNVNVAMRPRQPGSSFKPIVYATAFERGFTPDTIIFDLPTNFGSQKNPYRPGNYTGKTYGPVTARQALANSLNIASVKMLWLAGVEDTVALAKRLGITTLTEEPDHYGLSLVLGGGAVTLLEETAAFGVFAADGMRAETTMLVRVEDHAGNALFAHKQHAVRAVDEEIARQITDVLSDNAARALVFGAIPSLTLGARPVAVKTGTAQDFRDAWTIGVTPSLAAGVWVGNNDYSPMAKGADGSVVAAPIWNAFLREALADADIEAFKKPKTVKTGKPILDGVWAAEERVAIDRASGKRATDRTPPEWIEERVYRTVHDTLFWISRRNPRGAAPKNPSADPQFSAWEEAVQAWVASDPALLASVSERPPDATDDIHIQENEPRLTVVAPEPLRRVALPFRVAVDATARLGVAAVSLSIDDESFGLLVPERGGGSRYEKTVSLERDGGEGSRDIVLTVRVFDRYGNRIERSWTVSVTFAGNDVSDDTEQQSGESPLPEPHSETQKESPRASS